ncbi:MAG: hypothetical protein KDB03_29050, partial [Planctomycetales bacterium]|nr:hypothetical protein [Planctomycetales bacterium]
MKKRGQVSLNHARIWYFDVMPRPPRADEANGLYHALNRGNLRSTIFHKEGDYAAFEQILSEGLRRYCIKLF